MGLWLVTIAVILSQVPRTCSIEKEWLDKIDNANCNPSLLPKTNETEDDNISLTCPTWYYLSNDSKHCVLGRNMHPIIDINPTTKQVFIRHFYCTTKENNTDTTVLGRCLYSAVHSTRVSLPLPCNATDLNDYMCAGLNREGQLCGQCKQGFAPPGYSYSMECMACDSSNWIKYAAVAFGPLTLFFILVTVCHISPTSSYLHGIMFFSSVLSLPQFVRIGNLIVKYDGYKTTIRSFNILISVLAIWGLDFFRPLYTPFCVHPDMNTIQALAMDYLIALYPLFLLVVVYIIIQLYSHSFKPTVLLWSTVRPVMKVIKSYLKIETSFVNSFSTIFLFSSIKIQSVSFDLLLPTSIYYNHGPQDSKLFLYLAGDVEYFGPEHLPYAIIAICFLITLVFLPALLLFLYPCTCCQKLLNRLHCNSLALKAVMDAYQGIYKDGTNNTRDYRYFSGIFFLARTVIVVVLGSMNSYSFTTIVTLLLLGLTLSMAILHPQKSRISYTMDCFFTVELAVIFLYVSTKPKYSNGIDKSISILGIFLAIALPFVYTSALIVRWLFMKVRFPQNLMNWIRSKHETFQLHPTSDAEYSPLP